MAFALNACGIEGAVTAQAAALSVLTRSSYKRTFRRTEKSRGPRTYRTRPDPFADDWDNVRALLAADPERTATSLFEEIQVRHPSRHPAGQLRTLQRRVAAWRAQVILEFDETWLEADAPLGARSVGTLHLRLDDASSDIAPLDAARD